MRRELSIDIILNESYNDQNILYLLKRGETKFSFKYFVLTWKEERLSLDQLEIQQVLKKIKKGDENAAIECKHQDTMFYLFFFNKSQNLFFSLTPTSDPWKKEFYNGVKEIEFDMQRYLRLMLNLTQGLQISKIEAKIEWD